MPNTYIHLDSIDTLSSYSSKMYDWKHKLYELFDEMRIYHESLQTDQKWYGISHDEFYEEQIKFIYDKYIQPAAQFIDEDAVRKLRDLQVKAEELGTG